MASADEKEFCTNAQDSREPRAAGDVRVVFLCGLSPSMTKISQSFWDDTDKICHLAPNFTSALQASRLLSECIIIVDQGALDEVASVHLRISMNARLRVLVMIREATRERLTDLLRLGFSGFLPWNSSIDTLRTAIERVAAGEIWTDRRMMAEALRASISIVNDSRFTRREIEILRKIAAGDNNQKIADDLFVTRETVRWHLRSAYSKLGIHDRQAAAELVSNSMTA